MGSKNQGPWGDGLKVSSGRERERKRSVKRKNVVSKCGYHNIGVVIATGKANSRPQDWVLKPLDFQDHPLFFSDLLISNNNTSLSTYSPKRHCLRSSFPFLSSFFIFWSCGFNYFKLFTNIKKIYFLFICFGGWQLSAFIFFWKFFVVRLLHILRLVFIKLIT